MREHFTLQIPSPPWKREENDTVWRSLFVKHQTESYTYINSLDLLNSSLSGYFTPRKKRRERLNAFSKVTVNGQAKKANPDSLGLESSLLHLATAFQTKQDMFPN